MCHDHLRLRKTDVALIHHVNAHVSWISRMPLQVWGWLHVQIGQIPNGYPHTGLISLHFQLQIALFVFSSQVCRGAVTFYFVYQAVQQMTFVTIRPLLTSIDLSDLSSAVIEGVICSENLL